ncbi:MAG: tetratricopeptide repeat protein [Bacteroidota bacterium]|nr:tetratricopeptide repeat protein [Bacteroidota bacterium]
MQNNKSNKNYLPREWGWTQNLLRVLGRVMAIGLLIVSYFPVLKAQQTAIFTDEIKFYNRGLELYDKEKFAAAQKHFDWYARIGSDPINRINAEYYAAVCAMELFNQDALPRLNQILKKYTANPKGKLALYQIGKFHYRNKNNPQAVASLDLVQTNYLTGPDLKEFYFIYGYALFRVERFEDSKNAFKPIKDESSKYYDAANYYYGYVCYKNADYDEALTHFNRVKYHKTFGPLSAVYVAQVYFARKQYAEVIAFCDTLSKPEIANDVAGLIGQSQYQLKNYAAAIPHLEKFMKAAPVVPGDNDYFMLAESYAQTKAYEKAIAQFLKVDSKHDTLAKFVQYHLANCYLETGNKTAARAAFENCYQADSTSHLAEASLFFSAKLADELNLQAQATSRYVKLIDRYNDGAFTEEARSNLGNILLNGKNYREAIRILSAIKKPKTSDLTNLQRVTYYRAEELYLNNNYADAGELFKKAADVSYDAKIAGLANFWLSELAYKEQLYKESISYLLKFQEVKEVKNTRFYNHSFYNLGYNYLKQAQYAKAVEAFANYEKRDNPIQNIEIYTDAVLRIADCYFADKSYTQSLAYYDLMINKDLKGADYALFQKALILGLLNKNIEKINALKILEKNYAGSTYIDDAVYEIADNYLKNEAYDDAVAAFDNLISKYPRSVFLRQSILNKALALFNLKRDDEALDEIKKLITNYPSSEEAKEALPMVQTIFVNQGKGEEYLNFIKVLPNVVISASTQDSLSYESAFILYQKENYEKASKGFGNYIQRFPGGYFILKANYFKAESDYKLKKYDDALVHYEYVANALRSEYSERCTRQSAVLLNLRKNYEKAFEYFAALERIASNRDNLQLALLGQMRTCSFQGKIDSAAQASFRYLGSAIAQKEGSIEAHAFIGRYYIARKNYDSALVSYQNVLKENKGLLGAEAKYHVALVQAEKKDYKAAQKTIFELNDKFSAFEFWVAKGFLLLAETYLQQKDYFQAKATLQSLIENYDGKDILDQCKAKLVEIENLEQEQKASSQKLIEQRIKQSEK